MRLAACDICCLIATRALGTNSSIRIAIAGSKSGPKRLIWARRKAARAAIFHSLSPAAPAELNRSGRSMRFAYTVSITTTLQEVLQPQPVSPAKRHRIGFSTVPADVRTQIGSE